MNIHVEKEQIWPLINQVQGLLEKRTNVPIFENVLIQVKVPPSPEAKSDPGHIQPVESEMTLHASDSELSFSGDFSGEVVIDDDLDRSDLKSRESGDSVAQKDDEGDPEDRKKPESSSTISMVINGRRLFEIVRELSSGPISITHTKENRIKISQGDSNFQLQSLKEEDFPVFPPVQTKKFQKFRAEDLTEVIDKTAYCVSLDDSRYHLMGVYMESFPKESKYRWAATDGYRMSFIDAFVEKKLDFADKIIIPKKGFQEIRKMLSAAEADDEVELAVENPRLIARFKNQKLSVRLIEGGYPDYTKLIPKERGHEILLDREEFLAGLRRVSVLTGPRFKGVTFSFLKDRLIMEFVNTDTGEEAKETVPCSCPTSKMKIRLNSRYVMDLIQSMDRPKVKMVFKTGSKPCLFEEEGDRKENKNYTCIVMPMRF